MSFDEAAAFGRRRRLREQLVDRRRCLKLDELLPFTTAWELSKYSHGISCGSGASGALPMIWIPRFFLWSRMIWKRGPPGISRMFSLTPIFAQSFLSTWAISTSAAESSGTFSVVLKPFGTDDAASAALALSMLYG